MDIDELLTDAGAELIAANWRHNYIKKLYFQLFDFDARAFDPFEGDIEVIHEISCDAYLGGWCDCDPRIVFASDES